MKILVVEDEPKAGDYLVKGLQESGYVADLARNGVDGLALALEHDYELIVLDVMLPQMDGWAVLGKLRERKQTPVLFLTARDDVADRVKGLELGADDYLVKPFAFAELLARIKAILRRTALETPSARYYRFVGFTLDLMERKVLDNAGAVVALTGLDFQLLKYFVEHPGVILDRSVLCEETRGRDAGPLDRSLDVQISRLRLRLNDDGKQPALIKTVRGAGYVFSADVSVSHA